MATCLPTRASREAVWEARASGVRVRYSLADDSGSHPALWIGKSHSGSITRMEPHN